MNQKAEPVCLMPSFLGIISASHPHTQTNTVPTPLKMMYGPSGLAAKALVIVLYFSYDAFLMKPFCIRVPVCDSECKCV